MDNSRSHLSSANLFGSSGTSNTPDKPTLPFFSAVELHVFKTFVRNYSRDKELLREDAIALDYVFGPVVLQIFEMIEEERVCIRQSPVSKRVIVEVYSRSSPETYRIFPAHSFCQCMSFHRGKKEYCKHILAAHLYLAIAPSDKYKEISDNQLDTLCKELIDTDDK